MKLCCSISFVVMHPYSVEVKGGMNAHGTYVKSIFPNKRGPHVINLIKHMSHPILSGESL